MQALVKQVQQKVQIDVAKAFGLTGVTKPIKWEGFAARSENVPESDRNYVFEKLTLIEFYTLMNSNTTTIEIIGHTGTGKSSFVEEYHARLNLPLYVINAYPRITSADMVGQFIPTKDGTLVFTMGALSKAAIEGCSLLIDEYNVIDPAEATALNALLEGRSVFVPEINDWIHPAEGFKVITTINKKGPGYVGRNTQDAANDDRKCYMLKDYIAEDLEVELIKNYLVQWEVSEAVAVAQAEKFVAVANQVRSLYMGEDSSADALETTISTRSLLRWVELSMMFRGVKQPPHNYEPIHYALERAKTLQTTDETRIAIHKFVELTFGATYVTPLQTRTK